MKRVQWKGCVCCLINGPLVPAFELLEEVEMCARLAIIPSLLVPALYEGGPLAPHLGYTPDCKQ